MITKMDSFSTIEFKDYYVILPTLEQKWKISDFTHNSDLSIGKYVEEGFSYESGSNEKFLTVDEIRNLIEKV